MVANVLLPPFATLAANLEQVASLVRWPLRLVAAASAPTARHWRRALTAVGEIEGWQRCALHYQDQTGRIVADADLVVATLRRPPTLLTPAPNGEKGACTTHTAATLTASLSTLVETVIVGRVANARVLAAGDGRGWAGVWLAIADAVVELYYDADAAMLTLESRPSAVELCERLLEKLRPHLVGKRVRTELS